MKRVALVFVAAVLTPSLVLAWLAVRSLRDQQFVLERQQSLLYQGVAEAVAGQVREAVASSQAAFVEACTGLIRQNGQLLAARNFNELLPQKWPLAQVGFVVTTGGDILSPAALDFGSRQFLAYNGSFLANREPAEVYWNSGKIAVNNQFINAPALTQMQPAPGGNRLTPGQAYPRNNDNNLNYQANRKLVPQQQASSFIQRASPSPSDMNQVAQQSDVQSLQQGVPQSRIASSETEFHKLVGDDTEGTLARFVDDKLNVLFWYRPPPEPAGKTGAGKGSPNAPVGDRIYGAQVNLPLLVESLKPLVDQVEPTLRRDICVAIVNDGARPVALSSPGFQANWRHPFVATEIGEILPHWEVGVYLLDPGKLSQAARTLRITLGLLIGVLLSAIGVGSYLIVSELNRELTLARQKTDFVSNVSHELKTPLTSIRMFSELLLEGRVSDPARQRSFLEIISAETARLTRLINNVLDFARIERGEKTYHMKRCDLGALTREIAEAYRPHLEAEQFTFRCELEPGCPCIHGDRDALSQVILNLLSNAEKYSGETKEIGLRLRVEQGPAPAACIEVSDRGLGIPPAAAEKIFEQFYRAHDSLASGIQGSGLGLTLARQIARAHGGDVLYEPRPDGGSIFSIRLPLDGAGAGENPEISS